MPKKTSAEDLAKAATIIRGLSMDGVQAANSGHPGMPMGMADVAATLWLNYLNHCPDDAEWPDRDRFVLSAGHGSMLLYSLLHLSGYALSLDDLQNFRQWDSATPGHPEYGDTIGVDTTTGPLGQGCANAAGFALAERMLASRFNSDAHTLVDHYTYAIAGDGCLMEGISHEACSLAGHLGLERLILFYDSNHITIDGSIDLSCSDNVKRRFQGYNWNVIEIDGHDFEQIDKAIRKARRPTGKPTIIVCDTKIGFGSPNKVGTSSAHGEPLGVDEVAASKAQLGLPVDQTFYVSDEVRELFDTRKRSLKRSYNKWQRARKAFAEAEPEKSQAWEDGLALAMPEDLEARMPEFAVDKAVATRSASGDTMQSIAEALPYFVGGSADLAASNKNTLKGGGDVSPGSYAGRNINFGIREHAMCSMLNGMSLHGGLRVFGATFFVFLDYCRPAVRLAAIMKQPVVYVFTHDSVFLGEDGPTHQPIEHLAMLRATPNVTVLRPADATETSAAWVAALKNTTGPTLLALSRQNLKTLDRTVYPAASNVEKGAYVLWESSPESTPDVILMASGSEVELILDSAQDLADTVNVRVVSFPSWELFEAQSEPYKESVLLSACTRRLAVEAGCSFGWERYVGPEGKTICIDRFGASAPYKSLAQEFGFTVQSVIATVRAMM
ncbi:MAG: transketolase [Kiritimatiellae bacterium]|nr:transketolase [Kiritimatiellia bacterium]